MRVQEDARAQEGVRVLEGAKIQEHKWCKRVCKRVQECVRIQEGTRVQDSEIWCKSTGVLPLSVPTTYWCTNYSNYTHRQRIISHHLTKILCQKGKSNH